MHISMRDIKVMKAEPGSSAACAGHLHQVMTLYWKTQQ